MKKPGSLICMSWILAAALILWGVSPVLGAKNETPQGQLKKITQADRQAAAKRSAARGLVLPKIGTQQIGAEAGVMQMDMPAAPRYFSHPNYANSPLPILVAATEVVITDAGNPPGSGATAIAMVAGGGGDRDRHHKPWRRLCFTPGRDYWKRDGRNRVRDN
jgi:hypothetical protein